MLELLPLCAVELTIGPATRVGNGPSGNRFIAPVNDIVIEGDRLRGRSSGSVCADWVTVVGDVATIDVRSSIVTHDGALVFIQYRGRTDASNGVGSAPAYVAPLFETGDERYAWLNAVQAVGKSQISDLRTAHYDWYELR